MRRRELLSLPLLAACGAEEDVSFSRRAGARFNRGRVPSGTSYPGPGYNPFSPSNAVNVVYVGDSGTQGFGDDDGGPLGGGHVQRFMDQVVATYGAGHRVRLRGTNPVRKYVGTHWTEGHGGLEFKTQANWGSMAAGVQVDNADQALYNKPISGDGTGRPMFGLGGYHQQNLHLMVWCLGAGNVNNYGETASDVMALMLASLQRYRNAINQTSPQCKIAFMPDLWDWGGADAPTAALNHQRVLDINALIPDFVSTFNAANPGQALLCTDFRAYDAIGLYQVGVNFYNLPHPNPTGYTRYASTPLVGTSANDYLMPIIAGLLA